MSPTAFADSINVNRSSVTHIFTGRNQPSLDVAKKILNAFPEISSDWLIMGTGPMFREASSAGPVIPSDSSTPGNTQQTPKASGILQPDLFADYEDTATENAEPPASPELPVAELELDTAQPQTATEAEPVIDQTSVEEAARPSTSRRGRSGESRIADTAPKRERILKSQADRQLVRVVFFYSDRTCEVYNPS